MTENLYRDKNIVVTGGSCGIGLEIAKHFVKKNVGSVIILDINESEGKKNESLLNDGHTEKKVEFIKCNIVTDLEIVSSNIIKKYKKIDVIVNNAGIVDETNWKKCIDINLTAHIDWSYKFMEHMRIDKGGSGGVIINIASILGLQTTSFTPVYTSAKHALVAFSRVIGHKDNSNITGVRVIAICPGFTRTNMAKNNSLSVIETDGVLAEYLKNVNWQNANDVGAATLEIYEKAETGSAWIIEDGNTIRKAEFNRLFSYLPE